MKELKKVAVQILRDKGFVTITFGTDETKVVNNMKSLNRIFQLSEYFNGIKKIN